LNSQAGSKTVNDEVADAGEVKNRSFISPGSYDEVPVPSKWQWEVPEADNEKLGKETHITQGPCSRAPKREKT